MNEKYNKFAGVLSLAACTLAYACIPDGTKKIEQKDLEAKVYKIIAYQGITPSHCYTGENLGMSTGQEMYKQNNGVNHVPIPGVSAVYFPDINQDKKICGKPIKVKDLADPAEQKRIVDRRNADYNKN